MRFEGVPTGNDGRSPLPGELVDLLETLATERGVMVDLLSAMKDILRNHQEALDDLDARVRALELARDSDTTAESARMGEQDGREALRHQAAHTRRQAREILANAERLIADTERRTARRQLER